MMLALSAESLTSTSVDYFEVDSDDDRLFYLVQELAPGESVAAKVRGGWKATEDDIARVAVQVLDVLEYLGSLRPAVVHRDIKPENIIVDEGLGACLVDFGGVQEAAARQASGAEDGYGVASTVIVGTYGFMAPEQFRGRAETATDVYGLGATLLYMVSGRAPSSFPQKGLKVDFEGGVRASPKLTAVIAGMLQPDPGDRIPLAEARSLLRGDAVAAARPTQAPRVRRTLADDSVTVARSGDEITVVIEAEALNGDTLQKAAFTFTWLSFVTFWTFGALQAGVWFASFSLPFWFAGGKLAQETVEGLTTRPRRQIVTVDKFRAKVRKEPPLLPLLQFFGRGKRLVEESECRTSQLQVSEIKREGAWLRTTDVAAPDAYVVEELELVLGDDSPTPIGQGLDGRSLEAIASGITRFMRDAGYEVE